MLIHNFLLLCIFSLLLTVALMKIDLTDIILVPPPQRFLCIKPYCFTHHYYHIHRIFTVCLQIDTVPRNTISIKFRWPFKILTLISTCVCFCFFFPQITNQFSNTSWVSYNSTQFWHNLLRDSIGFHRLRAQSHKSALHFRCQS